MRRSVDKRGMMECKSDDDRPVPPENCKVQNIVANVKSISGIEKRPLSTGQTDGQTEDGRTPDRSIYPAPLEMGSVNKCPM